MQKSTKNTVASQTMRYALSDADYDMMLLSLSFFREYRWCSPHDTETDRSDGSRGHDDGDRILDEDGAHDRHAEQRPKARLKVSALSRVQSRNEGRRNPPATWVTWGSASGRQTWRSRSIRWHSVLGTWNCSSNGRMGRDEQGSQYLSTMALHFSIRSIRSSHEVLFS